MNKKGSKRGLGTFAGVFTPSILTILGIILFLRLSFVVGQAGLIEALAIVVVANAITILTSFSLAGIATNLRVKGGGDYYLISRTLGLGFGGAIGIVLFAAQSISVGFYCIGFAEAAVNAAGLSGGLWVRLFALAALAVLMWLAWLGTDWATRFQYFVLVLIVAGVVSFFWGGYIHWDTGLLEDNLSRPKEALPFWTLFAVFFPAVTGFTQGVSMSGDLRDPSRSIPIGTFAAVAISFAVYLGVVVVFAATLPQATLAGDGIAMKGVARLPALVDLGVFAATLSSALASFMGAPRILQSLARDRIFPILRRFAGGSANANPRGALVVTALIALMVVALGDLNVVASIVAMFFLVSYGLLNYATYYEAHGRSPFFRPRFRWYDERISLVGALACLGVVLAIDPMAGFIAAAVIGGIYVYLQAKGISARWADSRRSAYLQQARNALLSAAREPEHARDWRPELLVFSEDPERRGRLLDLSSWVEGGSGLTTVVRVIESRHPNIVSMRTAALDELVAEIKKHESRAFPLVVVAASLDDGISTTIQSAGLGPLAINTVMVNMSRREGQIADFGPDRFGQNLRLAFHLGCNLLILNATREHWDALGASDGDERRIDIWWTESATSPLMLLFAHLITRNEEWEKASIRVLVAGDETGGRFQRAREIIRDSRIDAEVAAVGRIDLAAFAALSRESSLVFLPMTMPTEGPFEVFGLPPDAILEKLPAAVLAVAAEDVELASDPDEGAASEMAADADRLADAAHKLKRLERQSRRLEKKRGALGKMLEETPAGEARESLTAQAEAAAAEAREVAAAIYTVKSQIAALQEKIGVE